MVDELTIIQNAINIQGYNVRKAEKALDIPAQSQPKCEKDRLK